MGVGRLHRDIEDCSDFLGSLAFGYQLYNLALPGRQSGPFSGNWATSLPFQVTVHDQIRHSRAEAGSIPLQRFHRCDQVISSVNFENPPANPCIQAVSNHLLGTNVGEDQYFLGGVVF